MLVAKLFSHYSCGDREERCYYSHGLSSPREQGREARATRAALQAVPEYYIRLISNLNGAKTFMKHNCDSMRVSKNSPVTISQGRAP